MNKTAVFIVCVFLLVFYNEPALAKRPQFVIPFNQVGSNIIIPIRINQSTELNFIFDTGVKHTIITELHSEDSLGLNFTTEMTIRGLGGGDPIQTLLSRQNEIEIEDFKIDSVSLFVMKENIFQLSRHLGYNVNGIIGYELIKNHVVRIDYSTKKLKFYTPGDIKIPRNFRKIPMHLIDSKPYINGEFILHGEKRNVNLLFDTGAELSLWLVNFGERGFNIPDKSIRTYIGQGLNGEIFGKVGRIEQFNIGGYYIKNPVTAFPDSIAIAQIVKNEKRDGTLGSEIIRRFNVILSYPDTFMYIRKNSYFNASFSFNTTGIEITQPIPGLRFYEVAELWEGSPAALAGLRKGDYIVNVNYVNTAGLSLIELKELLRSNSGFVRMTINRNGVQMRLRFRVEKI